MQKKEKRRQIEIGTKRRGNKINGKDREPLETGLRTSSTEIAKRYVIRFLNGDVGAGELKVFLKTLQNEDKEKVIGMIKSQVEGMLRKLRASTSNSVGDHILNKIEVSQNYLKKEKEFINRIAPLILELHNSYPSLMEEFSMLFQDKDCFFFKVIAESGFDIGSEVMEEALMKIKDKEVLKNIVRNWWKTGDERTATVYVVDLLRDERKNLNEEEIKKFTDMIQMLVEYSQNPKRDVAVLENEWFHKGNVYAYDALANLAKGKFLAFEKVKMEEMMELRIEAIKVLGRHLKDEKAEEIRDLLKYIITRYAEKRDKLEFKAAVEAAKQIIKSQEKIEWRTVRKPSLFKVLKEKFILENGEEARRLKVYRKAFRELKKGN